MLTAVLALVAALAVLAPRLPRLRDRYDSAALQPITGKPAGNAGSTPLNAVLRDWVMDGAGSGATLWPWSFPVPPRVLAFAAIPAAHRATVHDFAYQLAGYHQLDGRSRLGGIAYRVGVQLRPLLWFLPRRDDEPWDDAWLIDVDDARLTALANWQPRRPTLIILDAPSSGVAPRIADALDAGLRRNGSRYPIRLLILGDIDHSPASSGHKDVPILTDQRKG